MLGVDFREVTVWLLSQGVDPVLSPLVQFGALGILAAFLAMAVRVLFARETKTLDLERAQNAELRAELRKLNETIQDRILTALADVDRMARALETSKREADR